MRAYVKKLQQKPHHIRRQIMVGGTAVFMAFVLVVWAFSLHQRFSSPDVALQTQSDIKPFAAFGQSLKSTLSDISASAADSRADSSAISQSSASAPAANPASASTDGSQPPAGKMIPLVQVNPAQ